MKLKDVFKPINPSLLLMISEDTDMQAQLERGIEIEMEHTKVKEVAKIIALHHLAEFKDYYTFLDKAEKMMTPTDIEEWSNQ